jgi:hypothetical protein
MIAPVIVLPVDVLGVLWSDRDVSVEDLFLRSLERAFCRQENTLAVDTKLRTLEMDLPAVTEAVGVFEHETNSVIDADALACLAAEASHHSVYLENPAEPLRGDVDSDRVSWLTGSGRQVCTSIPIRSEGGTPRLCPLKGLWLGAPHPE